MDGQMIESLKRAYAEAVYESKRHDTAAEAIATAIRCLSGEKVAPPVPTKPVEIETARPAAAQAKTEAAPKKIYRKAAKEGKAPKAERQEMAAKMSRVCPHCGCTYLAKRKDQTNCLADECRKAAQNAWKEKHADKRIVAQVAAKAAPAAAPAGEPAGTPSRLERIKALAGGGEVQ